MIRTAPIAAITLRGLLDRRRSWLMFLLAAVPVLVTLIVMVSGDAVFSVRSFDQLMIRTVMPLIALVFGTAALGTELDDGTIIYLIAKPIRRARLVVTKSMVAAGLTVALVVPATVLSGFIASTQNADLAGATVAYAVAAAVGATAYAVASLALSTFTSRALIIALLYVLLWEGTLADLFDGVRLFSIRQATLGLAAELQGVERADTLDGGTSIVILALVILGALALASWRVSRFQLRGGD